MQISKIGKKLIPAVFAISTITAGNAYANNQIKNSLNKEENKTELLVKENSAENKNSDFSNSLKDYLLLFGFGTLSGYAGARILSDKKKKNSSFINYFGKDFKKDSKKIFDYMESVLNKSIENSSYKFSSIDYMVETSFYTKKYLSKKEYINMFARTIQDKRLNSTNKKILGQYLILKTICSSENERVFLEEYFSFFKNKNSYEELVSVLNIKKEEVTVNTASKTNKNKNKTDKKENEEEDEILVFDKVHHNLKFKDVGGQSEAIKFLKKNILFPIKYPDFYKNNNINHGFLLYGPPGTGKTLLSETLANESNSNFIKLNGNDLTSKWVGESEENWRKLFKEAKEKQPTIIFIDEFDGIASKRGKGDVYNDKIVNQILGLLSDIEKNNYQIFVIAATNRKDMIDDAILRAGRIGKHIELKAPQNKDEVKEILNIHLSKKPYYEKLDIDSFSEELFKENVTGADISSIVNDAFESSMERNLIFEKMENNNLKNFNIEKLKIMPADLTTAINNFRKNNRNNNKIGFNKN